MGGPGNSPEGSWPPVVRLLDGWHAEEVLATPGSREFFFHSLTAAAFDARLFALNNVIEGTDRERGYVPPEVVMYQEESPEQDALDHAVLYVAPAGQHRPALIDEAFAEAKFLALDDTDAAIAMLGIAQIAIHAFSGSHTRTMAVGRQLLSPAGRGYRGTDEDRAFYARLSTDRDTYLAQSLHPLRGDLIARYCGWAASRILLVAGYDGPPIAGVTATDNIRSVYRLLPPTWEEGLRRVVAITLSERTFNVVTMLSFLQKFGVRIEGFLVGDPSNPKLSLHQFLALDTSAHFAHAILAQADEQKNRFVGGIIRSIAQDRPVIFGGRQAILQKYPLPRVL